MRVCILMLIVAVLLCGCSSFHLGSEVVADLVECEAPQFDFPDGRYQKFVTVDTESLGVHCYTLSDNSLAIVAANSKSSVADVYYSITQVAKTGVAKIYLIVRIEDSRLGAFEYQLPAPNGIPQVDVPGVGNSNIIVSSNGTVVLSPGTYREVRLNRGLMYLDGSQITLQELDRVVGIHGLKFALTPSPESSWEELANVISAVVKNGGSYTLVSPK